MHDSGVRLFHFSEDGSISKFEPRAPTLHPETPPHVWAIDEWHSPIYLLPRDCPRVCFWPVETTTQEDIEGFWAQATARIVVAIEAAWLDRFRTTRLYRYTFDGGEFLPVEDHGVHVSQSDVVPIAVDLIDDLPQALADSEVELRVCPTLVPLADAVMKTTLHWSLIRMRNAQDWTRAPGSPTLPKGTTFRRD